MSLSRRDFLKFGTATATGVAVGANGLDLTPVEAAATSLKIKEAKVVRGVCPYCAVGCGQLIYAKDGKIIDIEGDPDTPHTLGRLCPKGAATIQLSNNPLRPTKALYRAPGSETWEEKPLEWMYEQVAKRYYETREKYLIEKEKTKERGAKFIHVDPRFTRTSAAADIHVPLRSGTNIVFFGGLINYAIEHNLYFKDYVVHYTNASFLIDPAFKTATDLDGLFTGYDPGKKTYDKSSWKYQVDGEGNPQRDP